MTTNPTATPLGTVRPPVPGGRHRITDYDALIDELDYTYDGTFSKASIAQAVAEARAALQPTARIPDFLPILVGRFAREQLTAAAQAAGKITKPVPELLFVCVQNAGRSQMAAALAQHLSAGRVHVRSAGKRYLDWDVPDPDGRPIEEVRDIRDDLQARVTALLRDFNI
jgi:arsenate reductase (thioredoxin)